MFARLNFPKRDLAAQIAEAPRSPDEDAQRLAGVFFRQGVFRMIREWITRGIPKSPIFSAAFFSGKPTANLFNMDF